MANNLVRSAFDRQRSIQRCIFGDEQLGQMDAGLDTGDMLLKLSCPIDPSDTAQTLHDKLAVLGGQAIVEALNKLEQGSLQAVTQDDAQATYAAKLTKAEAQIDWSRDAVEINRMVRAYNPFPVAVSAFNAVPVKVWQASLCNAQGRPGTVLTVEKNGIVVACGKDALRLETLQRPGAKALPAAQFIQGFTIRPGDRFTAA